MWVALPIKGERSHIPALSRYNRRARYRSRFKFFLVERVSLTRWGRLRGSAPEPSGSVGTGASTLLWLRPSPKSLEASMCASVLLPDAKSVLALAPPAAPSAGLAFPGGVGGLGAPPFVFSPVFPPLFRAALS